jgi:hypothetical protein
MSNIANAGDKKVKGLYMLIQDEISNNENFTFSDEHIKILEEK